MLLNKIIFTVLRTALIVGFVCVSIPALWYWISWIFNRNKKVDNKDSNCKNAGVKDTKPQLGSHSINLKEKLLKYACRYSSMAEKRRNVELQCIFWLWIIIGLVILAAYIEIKSFMTLSLLFLLTTAAAVIFTYKYFMLIDFKSSKKAAFNLIIITSLLFIELIILFTLGTYFICEINNLSVFYTVILMYTVFILTALSIVIIILAKMMKKVRTRLSYGFSIIYIVFIYIANLFFSSFSFSLLNSEFDINNNLNIKSNIRYSITQMNKNFNFPDKPKYDDLEFIRDKYVKNEKLLNQENNTSDYSMEKLLNNLEKHIESTKSKEKKSLSLSILYNIRFNLENGKTEAPLKDSTLLQKYCIKNINVTVPKSDDYKNKSEFFKTYLDKNTKSLNYYMIEDNLKGSKFDYSKINEEDIRYLETEEKLKLLIISTNTMLENDKGDPKDTLKISDEYFYYISVIQYIIRNLIDWLLLGVLAAILFEIIKYNNESSEIGNIKSTKISLRNKKRYFIKHQLRASTYKKYMELFKEVKVCKTKINELNTIVKDKNSSIETLTAIVEDNKRRVSELNSKHKVDLNNLKEMLGLKNQNNIQNLQQEYQDEIKELDENHNLEIDECNRKYKELLNQVEEKGIQKKLKKEKIDIAAKMIKDGESIEKVKKYTELDENKILKLIKQIENEKVK